MSFGNTQPTDPELVEPPTDSISCVKFSPNAPILAVGSWNNEVRLYEVNAQGQSQAKALHKHEGPVLDICWTTDGAACISAGADKAARAFDLGSGQSRQVAGHDLPIRSVRYSTASSGSAYLMTGGWDKQLRYWDLRTQGMVGAVQLPERCYTMDAKGDLLVVGTAERKVQMYDFRNPGTPVKTVDSPLKWQTRVVSCFPSTTKPGYALGSIEGRIAYTVIPEQFSNETFSFRCHRKEAPGPKTTPPKPVAIFAVNTISFHKGYETFVSGGGDGMLSFWDAQARARLKTITTQPNLSATQTPTPIVATDFNHDCTVLAWAQSYDWSRGHAGFTPDMVNRVGLHVVKDDDVKRKAK